MPTIPEAFAVAMEHHQAGRLEKAESIYRQILGYVPDHFDTLHCLGVLHAQAGRFSLATETLERAVAANPQSAEAHNDLASAWKYLGEFDKAVANYRLALQLAPDFAAAHGNLGLTWMDKGNAAEAIACYLRALQLAPDDAATHFNLGNAYRERDEDEEAAACFRRALELNPNFAEAYANLGYLLQNNGNLNEAISCYRRAVQLAPDSGMAHNNLGNALREQGDSEEAIRSYQRAVQLDPDLAGTRMNLGNLLFEQGRVAEAATCHREALARWPDFAEAHNNLGNALRDLGQSDEAINSYREALRLSPDFAEAHSNLGNVWHDLGRLDEAIACYRRALELKPDFADAHCNLGAVLQEQGHPAEAIPCFRAALELKPGLIQAQRNLGNALRDCGDPAGAADCHRRAFELQPGNGAVLGELCNQLQHNCAWSDLTTLAQSAVRLVERSGVESPGEPISPFMFLALPVPTTAEQQLQSARRWVSFHLRQTGRLAPTRSSPKSERITLGYLSADFHSHATAYLIAELFERHDRERFSVIAYSYGPDDGSAVRRRIVQGVDRFVELRTTSHAAAAERIAADRVDILVDLKGYTHASRPQILALRPAPIQVNYLGYPGTMGAPFIDYVVVDDFVVPADQQTHFSERLVHLPGCYQINDSRREIAARTPTRIACGLPESGFVFCGFHTSYKITSEMFDVWMELLRETPGSVLWLLERNRTTSDNLRCEAESRGVTAERLVFGPSLPLAEHLARHRLADLFLDTFPVNAHTTASDALWAGCPVITRAGSTFISRVAGSLLRTIGLPELVTTGREEYRDLALKFAREPERLAALRERLATNRTTSALFNAAQFAGNLERTFETMQEIRNSAQEPRAFAVASEADRANQPQ